MRERPKQASYVERHRNVEANVPIRSSIGEKKMNQPTYAPEMRSIAAAIIPKKVDRSGDVAASRVRAGGASKVSDKGTASSNAGPGGGKMTQYRSLDDIPDGLPATPQLENCDSSRIRDSRYSNDADDDDDDDYEYSNKKHPDSSSSYEVAYKQESKNYSPSSPAGKYKSSGNNGYGKDPYRGGEGGGGGGGGGGREGSNGQLSKYPPDLLLPAGEEGE